MLRTTVTAVLGVVATLPLMHATADAGVMYHRYEDGTVGSAATSITDTTVNGLDGSAATSHAPTYNAAQPVSPVPQNGLINTQSLDFNRGSESNGTFPGADYYTVADSNLLDFDSSESFTIEAWVQIDELAVAGDSEVNDRVPLLMKKNTGSPDTQANYLVYLNGSGIGGSADRELLFQFGTGAAPLQSVNTSLTIDDNDWHFVSIAVDQATNSVRFGVDGVFETITGISALDSITTNNHELIVGTHFNAGSNIDGAFDGRIDELRISEGFLAPEQLLAVPEPSSLAIAGLAGLMLAGRRRRA